MKREKLKRQLIATALLSNFAYNADAQTRLSAEAGFGYETAEFNWSIAGNSTGTNPNVLSELIWQNLHGVNATTRVDLLIGQHMHLDFYASRTGIRSGRATDTDYRTDGRKEIAFFGNFDSNRGELYRAQIIPGWRFFWESRLTLVLSSGYFISGQHLWLLDNAARYDANLRSTYQANWNGGVLMAKAIYTFGKLQFSPSFGYYQATYNAEGNWNLIPNFEHPRSYRHEASGYGLLSELIINYKLRNSWFIGVDGSMEKWKTGKGTDRLYRVTGERPETLLNGADFHTDAFRVVFRHEF